MHEHPVSLKKLDVPLKDFTSETKVDEATNTISVALKNDGTVWSWGDNEYGQLGDGNSPTDSEIPVQVLNLSNVISINTGYYHTVALKSIGYITFSSYLTLECENNSDKISPEDFQMKRISF